MITSKDNAKLKEARRLRGAPARRSLGRFVAEGEDLVAAAGAAGWTPVALLAAEGSGLAGDAVAAELLAGVSSLGSGTRTLAIYEQRWAEPRGPRCVYLHGVRDPGNVGTILRSALAFGAASVVLGPGCADPYGPKAVRASMGAVFAVALARAAGVAELPGETLALVPRAGARLAEAAAQAGGATTLVVGAERDGLPADIVAACTRTAHIPIAAESLNVAMATTVALYELTRAAAPATTDAPVASTGASPTAPGGPAASSGAPPATTDAPHRMPAA